ncbi:TCP-1/cpn60 chaperonin, partial [Helicosporidium sp. ATCC 50920]
APVTVLQTNTRRDSGRKAQLGNIMVAKSVADIVRTTLGPRAMLKMLLDANGSLVLTNDGNAILREIDVSHPAAKSIIELSRTQAEEVGDGTTSVIILAGEMLQAAEPFLQRSVHATVIIRAYLRALEDALRAVDKAAFAVDVDNRDAMLNVVGSCIGTKFANRFGSLLPRLALDAVLLISGGLKAAPAAPSAPDASSTAAAAERAARRAADFDYKKWARVEKIPGASVEDSRVLRGVMFE